SSFGKPPQTDLIRLPGHTVVRSLAANEKLRAAVAKLTQTPVEFFRADANGVKLDGWLMPPVGYDPTKKYPVLFFVYGEPAGQTAVDRWGGSRHLWHLMLTQMGYAVACVDNRGTPAPRGRDWRKAVYRKIGTLAAAEQAAAARDLLASHKFLDPARVGAWGWSGGGSMTLNLLFRTPDLYRTGMAVAPVPDMRLYDTIYQERYMGLPQDNPDDYKTGSPITHAAGLAGNLLVVHGTGDDNCHYQGVEKLADKLIELNKPFTMMPYPNRSHSINEGKTTSRHLHGLLTRFLTDNLPVGPKP
ncbi:MAG: alpha/beta hydrolase family protein, partial [Fimbriiglobus sp.]